LILGCAIGKTNTAVARELRVTKQTVGKWRTRFVAKRLHGVLDEPRPGAPRPVTIASIAHMSSRPFPRPRPAPKWPCSTPPLTASRKNKNPPSSWLLDG